MRAFCFLACFLAGCATPPHIQPNKTLNDLGQTAEFDGKTERSGAAWFEIGSRLEGNAPSPFEHLELSAVGTQRAIVLTTFGYVDVDRHQGMVGHLAAIDPADQPRLGDNDSVLVMRTDGRLVRFAETKHL